ncbi:circularly permutated Ras protein 1-like isoform X2 [Narcine bancroftii]|uniref:circularly permutated Ras protein 1-like isoform X2 n=1 Tax=Narcine bancroftii TaxID=1343680 RepID=UPI0038310FDC
MEFASSHFYIIGTPAADQPNLGGASPLGTECADGPGSAPAFPFYQPVEGCDPNTEQHQVVNSPLYDLVYEACPEKLRNGGALPGEDPLYQNYRPVPTSITISSTYSNSPNLCTATGEQEHALGSSCYDRDKKAGQHFSDAPPVPPPRRSRVNRAQGAPPPLPPRPATMKQVPEYIKVIDGGTGPGPLPGHLQSAKGACPPLPPRPVEGFPKSKHKELTEDVNVVLVNLGKLVDIQDVKPLDGTAVYCQNCSAAMSTCSGMLEPIPMIWKCEFCDNRNALDYRLGKGMSSDDQVYVHLPNPLTSEDIGDSLVVFCVDTSGSMSVTFEQAMGRNSSGSLYMSRLQVTIFGDGLGPPHTLQDFELIDQEYLKRKGLEEPLPQSISESKDALRHRIQMLQECGSTALGPAALISIAMAAQKAHSKVIICTDGRANTILGNLEDIKKDEDYQCSKLFYRHLAEYAMKQGVIVSVLTIEGTDCRLPELGQLADKTGGKVNITNPASLYNEFELILEDHITATNVLLTFFADDGLYFKYEDNISHKSVKQIGNVVKDMTITFEFGIKDMEREELRKKALLPFQLQIAFQLRDGRCVNRIVTQQRPTTDHSAIVKENINLSVLQIHAAQTSARLAMEGKMQDAQETALSQKELIEDVLSRRNDVEQEAIYESWMQSMSPIYGGFSHCKQGKATTTPIYEAVGTKRDSDSVVKSFSDDIANVVYRLKNAKKKMFKKPKFLVAI